ncbi:hypothetical protein BDW22DRAFT_1353376 [Trametopsis cervina]|nr:hypothetical protein BDW22DRAFT_1353376 [Trametopsis cervina]
MRKHRALTQGSNIMLAREHHQEQTQCSHSTTRQFPSANNLAHHGAHPTDAMHTTNHQQQTYYSEASEPGAVMFVPSNIERPRNARAQLILPGRPTFRLTHTHLTHASISQASNRRCDTFPLSNLTTYGTVMQSPPRRCRSYAQRGHTTPPLSISVTLFNGW